jgi:dTMP kinase
VSGAVAGGRGVLISLEGVDGCGKSSQLRRLRDALVRRGVPVGVADRPGGTLREPGGTPLGESIRRQLLHHRHHMDPWAEALLYAAARAQLTRSVLVPSLEAGWVVLIDRFIDSSLAYQGYARGLGVDRVLDLNLTATGGLLPDLTVIVALDPQVAAARRTAAPDRIEREGLELQRRVAEGYALLAERFAGRVHVVDGDRPRAAVASDVLRIATAVLERTPCSRA